MKPAQAARKWAMGMAAALAAGWATGARAGITVLQQGVAPSAAYTGCVDTCISSRNWENRNNAYSPILATGPRRRILMRFELAPIPAGDTIHKAVLRLSETSYLKKNKQGAFDPHLVVRPLKREWRPDAGWTVAWRENKPAGVEAAPWAAPGGDVDTETDFGLGAPGLAGTSATAAGAFGHAHDLEVTELVRRWAAGALPNHGMSVEGPGERHPECMIAGAEWHVPDYRPRLIVDHGPQGSAPTGIAPLPLAPAAIELAAVVGTADTGQPAEEYRTLRVGQAASCNLRGKSATAYVKEAAARYPGPWGWMYLQRCGGAAGDVNRALVYFDLAGLSRKASVKSAKLVLPLVPWGNREVAAYRYGAWLLKLEQAPGWDPLEATASEGRAGLAWPGGGVLQASAGAPVALGAVVQGERQRDGRPVKIPVALEFDLTGTVRAWLQGQTPNCGLAIDNRIEGGMFDFCGSRCDDPGQRPYLEIEMAPADVKPPEPIAAGHWTPAGDDWVEAMRKVRARFKGEKGTFAQYGDSITVTGAFLANYGWSGRLDPKNCPPDVLEECAKVAAWCQIKLWRAWKEGQYGNTGMMKSDWLMRNIDGWQRKMNPETAVILFGSNDIGGLTPPEYTENMAASVRRMMEDGTVPMLTTVPPKNRADFWNPVYYAAICSIGEGLKVPIIDYYGEIVRRRPEDWNGALEKFKGTYGKDGYQVKTLISADGTHPSNPSEYVNDFSEEALNASGYTLRNYLTIRKYYEAITKVFEAP